MSFLGINIAGSALETFQEAENVTSQNIANVQTPGFVAQDVSFEDQLAGIFNGQSSVSENASGAVIDSPDLSASTDGNTVSMESQMSKESQTSLLYNTLSQLTADRFSILKSAMG